MADHKGMKLGRKAVKNDSRTLALADYITKALPPPPQAVDYTKGVTAWGMMLNDKLGCCTIAGVAHADQTWTLNTTGEYTAPDPLVLSYYEKWDGYVNGDASTDNGGCELDVLNNWKAQGFNGHQIYAYASANIKNLDDVRQAINLFGGVYLGIGLPLTAQTQDVWDVAGGGSKAKAGSWGGHCVWVNKYDQNTFTCITWGAPKQMTVKFFSKYCDEAWAILSHDWITAKGSPSGFALDQLQADLALIK